MNQQVKKVLFGSAALAALAFGGAAVAGAASSDGTSVEVHLDSSFNVRQGPAGPGFGG